MDVTPVVIEIDEKDPERVYGAVRGKDTYLLESSEGGEKVARYSFIGFNPVAKVTVDDGKLDYYADDRLLKSLKPKNGSPLEVMRGLMGNFTLRERSLARFFGGFVGYLSYDTVRYHVELDGNAKNDLKQPDCEFVLSRNNVIFDHKRRKTYLTSNEFGDDIDVGSVKSALEEIAGGISENGNVNDSHEKERMDYGQNQTEREFMENVNVAKRYIRAGDIFQVVLSHRLETDYKGDKFHVYRVLKDVNPSPYMYYLDLGDRKVVGSSPEMLVRVEGKRVETYPIAGTRPRGKTSEEDDALGREMLNDEKERAEHVMLVDLGRNDVGRVARYGTVNVTRFMEIEKYSHVQHMISEVVGLLMDEKDQFDALRSIFPAGTVSGAPKVRAMEIIDELEPTRRGIYSGCVGYFSFNGDMDTAITIRTIVFEKDRANVQVGAGIVADSKPENEFREVMNKGRAMLGALEK